ncbi:MAG: hypothetical protein A2X12_00620 [Bacteroidetes bacterium GWE2_29_8]|nr:MAG: hypothetical protein A2X12_00620 [Bacteroidetes bacterium GWE2_29_8]OFY20637.1 MAG: hypothetical protein A2X02_06140 [Bacteroidetes bacterium GWF2_29_10]
MKRLFLFSFLLSLFLLSLSADGKTLRSLFAYNLFYLQTDNMPYIETYLSVNSSTVKFYKNSSNKYQSTLVITMSFKQNGKLIKYNKYNLRSLEFSDTTEVNDIFDMQRFSLANGVYDFDLSILDSVAGLGNEYNYSEKIEVKFNKDSIEMSSITMVDTIYKTINENILTKNGVDIYPRILNFYPDVYNKINVYAEVYNLNKHLGTDEKFIVRTSIFDANSNKDVKGYVLNKRESAKATNVILSEIPIDKLPSGNYFLEIKLLKRDDSEIVSGKIYFQRSNNIILEKNYYRNIVITNTFAGGISDLDTLREYIRCLSPLSSISEKQMADNFIRENDIVLLQKYFYEFWHKRNEKTPEKEWLNYLKNVQIVNAKYGSKVYKGYETDMGRVYLQYGAPNSISSSENEPSALPYQIWHYYKIGNYTNKRFVFYTPFLANNNYVLLHSDMIGEPNDERWKVKIYSRNNPAGDAENTEVESHFGDKLDDYFKNPR